MTGLKQIFIVMIIMLFSTFAYADFIDYNDDYSYILEKSKSKNKVYEQVIFLKDKSTNVESGYVHISDKKLKPKDISAVLDKLIIDLETPTIEDDVYIDIKEVEEVLKDKELIEENETWEDFKEKPILEVTP